MLWAALDIDPEAQAQSEGGRKGGSVAADGLVEGREALVEGLVEEREAPREEKREALGEEREALVEARCHPTMLCEE